MKPHAPFAAVFFALANLAAAAAPAPPRAPKPPSPPTVEPTPPPPCVDSRNSADYVPGADAQGRPVPPADLPGTAGVQIGTELFPLVNSKNPQVPTVGVDVNLPGLEA